MEEGRAPVSQSELWKHGKSLLPGLISAGRGLASALADSQRAADQAEILHNLQQVHKRFIWTQKGIGYTHDNESAINSGAAILDFGKFYDSTGTLHLLLQCGDDVFPYNFTTHAVGTAITGLTGLSTTHYPCMRAYAPSAQTAQSITIYCNGDIQPRRITSTSASSSLQWHDGTNLNNAWPVTFAGKTYNKPKFCENFGDRMVFSGFPDAATQYDVLITNQGSAEKFSVGETLLATDACVFTALGSNGPITGIKSFRPSNTDIGQIFVIGQKDGVSMITGTNTLNYRMDLLTDMYGICNNRCWVQVFDDLIYLTNRGIYSFSSLLQNATKPQDSLSYLVSDFIQKIDFDTISAAFAVQHPITQEIQFWVPWIGDSGINYRGLILNYNTDGGLGAPIWSTKDLNGSVGINSAIDFRNVMYGGGYDGFLQKHYDGDEYNGEEILYRYVSAIITVGNIQQAGRMKQITVVTDGQKQKFGISVYAYSKYADGSSRKNVCTPSNYRLGDGGSDITTLPFPLGQSSFPSDFVKKHNFSPIGRGYSFKIELSNTNTTGDGLDYSHCDYTISIGGINRL